MAAMGLPDGVHQLSDLFVDVFDGRAQLKGSSTLAGRSATLIVGYMQWCAAL